MTRTFDHAIAAGKAALVATLCLTMAAPQAWAEAAEKTAAGTPTAKAVPLTHQQKNLHALNRLTFGPRPGDEQAIAKMGLDAWFDRQLHPETIDDSALEGRLAQFPALKLSQEQLIQRFPSPQMIRQMSQRGIPLPNDPVLHAIYADAMANYDAQQKKLAAGQQAVGVKSDPMMAAGDTGGMQDDASSQTEMMTAQPGAGNSGNAGMAMTKVKGKGKKAIEATPMTLDEMDAILALPPDQRIDKLVAMSPSEMMSFRVGLKPFQRALLVRGLSPAQLEIVGAMQAPIRVVGAEALQARLVRDVYSERQLQAVMADFWLNHFSVYARKNQNEPYYLASYERDTILPNALGKFEDLLVATAKSPAMLIYLDNWQSIGPDSPAASQAKRLQKFADQNPQRKGIAQIANFVPKGINENYARELMELHTLGVRCEVSADKPASMLEPSCGAGYTQADVTNVAKVLTGWTIDRPYGRMAQGFGFRPQNARGPFGMGGRQPQPQDTGTPGSFAFQENRHEGGSKQVLGTTIREGGEDEGMQVLHMLATSPATAAFISHKLAVRFVADNPPKALEDRMAATFLKTNGDIKAVLSTMFHSQEFWSPEVYRAKLKTPIEFMTSALRASDANVVNPLPLVQAMEQLGMPIYGMQTPNGYSWLSEPWASSNALVSRMNFAVVLSGGRVPGTRTDWQRLTGDAPDSADPATEHKLEALILGQPAAERTRETVLRQASNPTVQRDAEKNFGLQASGDDATPLNTNVMMKRVGAKRGNGGDMLRADVPETPLGTMAGLLMGSPDFQRR